MRTTPKWAPTSSASGNSARTWPGRALVVRSKSWHGQGQQAVPHAATHQVDFVPGRPQAQRHVPRRFPCMVCHLRYDRRIYFGACPVPTWLIYRTGRIRQPRLSWRRQSLCPSFRSRVAPPSYSAIWPRRCYVGGITEQAIGKAAPWFVLAVMFFGFTMRSIYMESCGMFVRGGVYVVVRDSIGPRMAKLSRLRAGSRLHPDGTHLFRFGRPVPGAPVQ